MILWTPPTQLAFWLRVNTIFESCWRWVYSQKITPLQPPTPNMIIQTPIELPTDANGIMLFYVNPKTGHMHRINYESGKYDA